MWFVLVCVHSVMYYREFFKLMLSLYDNCRALHLGLLYFGSLVVLLVYSILYGLTAKESHWLGAITSAAVIILGISTIYIYIYMLIMSNSPLFSFW